VIDASGGRGWLARRLGIGCTLRSEQLIATFGYVETGEAVRWYLPRLKSVPGGWIWTAQVRENVVAWSRLRFRDRQDPSPPHDVLLPGSQSMASVGSGADVTWRCLERAAGSGWFAVGDAAFVLDPSSSHGVLRGLMSGIMASSLCARVARGEISEESAALSHSTWLRAWFDHDSTELASLYRRLPDAPTWAYAMRAPTVNSETPLEEIYAERISSDP